MKALQAENELLSQERNNLEAENRALKAKPSVLQRFSMNKKLKESGRARAYMSDVHR